MSYRGYPLPNLINGVSQQAAQQRRDTQCEEQINCINSPVDGCDARPGTQHVAFFPEEDWRDAFIYDVVRDDNEQYRLVLLNDGIRVFNILDGTEGVVHIDDPLDRDYLMTLTGKPKDLFRAITVEDTTFIANSEVQCSMVPNPPPPFEQDVFEGFIHVKQGDYLATYTVHVGDRNVWYSYTFSTPDNSQGSHASQVKQDYIANQLFRRMRDGQDESPALPSLGFRLSRIGAVIRIQRTGANGGNFDVGGEDGASQDRMLVFKDQVNRYAQLPPVCWDGTKINVKGSADNTDLNFWVEYISLGGGGRRGRWEECPAPYIPIHVNRGSMPHMLHSLGPNEYEFRSEIWDPRVAGDGDKKGRDPSFIGRTIQDLTFFRDRVAIMTSSSITWSKASQFYSYFPDTVQTTLDDAPVDVRIASTQIALLKHAVAHAEALFLWAQKIQFVVESGEEFAERTVEINPTTAFDYSPQVRPEGVGENLIFTSNSEVYSQVWEQFATAQGVNKEANDITSHVPKYIPKGIRWFTGSTALKLYAMNSPREPNVVYVYNYFMVGEEKQQSAWNKWVFPEEHDILHAQFEGHTLRLVVQRPEGITFETLDASPAQVDPDGGTFLTRLDRRVSEADCTWQHVPGGEGELDTTVVTLPYEIASTTGEDIGQIGTAFDPDETPALTTDWLALTSAPADRDGYLKEVNIYSPAAQTISIMPTRYVPPPVVGNTVGKITPVTTEGSTWGGTPPEEPDDTIIYPVAVDIVGRVRELHIALPEIPYDPGEDDPGSPPPIEPIDEQAVEVCVFAPGAAPGTLTKVNSALVMCRAGLNDITNLDIPIEPGQYMGVRTPHGVLYDGLVPGAASKWIINGEVTAPDTPITYTTSSPHPNFQLQIRATGREATDFGKHVALWDEPFTFTATEEGLHVFDLSNDNLWIDKGTILAVKGSAGLELVTSTGTLTDNLGPSFVAPEQAVTAWLENTAVNAAFTTERQFVTLPEGHAACLVNRAHPENDYVVGKFWPIIEASGNQVVVEGILPEDAKFFFGFTPTALYEFSEFHPKDERGPFIYERVQVKAIRVACSSTAWTTAEVIHRNGRVLRKDFNGRVLGSPVNRLNEVPLFTGTLRVPIKKAVGEFRCRLINPTPFPSRWQSATVDFRPTVRVQRI